MAYDMTTVIADNIKKYRILHHMTQEQISERLSLDTQYYAQLERAERKFSIEKICAVCDLFDIDISDIIVLPNKKSGDNRIASQTIIENLSAEIKTLNLTQLRILEKYVSEILPLQK